MEIIYWLIPLTILILIGAIYVFFWAVKDGQFDDLDSPAVNLLFDNDLDQNISGNLSSSNSIDSGSASKSE